MSRQVAIKQSRDKRESRLTEVENRNQKMSVYHHRPVAVLGVRMSIHTIQRKRDFGGTDPEPRLCGNMVTWRPMLTTSAGGVFA